MAVCSEAKSAKISQFLIFDAKLCFGLLVLLRSAILSVQLISHFPTEVNLYCRDEKKFLEKLKQFPAGQKCFEGIVNQYKKYGKNP